MEMLPSSPSLTYVSTDQVRQSIARIIIRDINLLTGTENREDKIVLLYLWHKNNTSMKRI